MARDTYFNKLSSFKYLWQPSTGLAVRMARDPRGAEAGLQQLVDALKELYKEEDVHRDAFRNRMKIFLSGIRFFDYSEEVREVTMEACARFAIEMVSEYYQGSTRLETYGAKCPHCKATWKWSAFPTEMALCCAWCHEWSDWMTFLTHWIVANGLPSEWKAQLPYSHTISYGYDPHMMPPLYQV